MTNTPYDSAVVLASQCRNLRLQLDADPTRQARKARECIARAALLLTEAADAMLDASRPQPDDIATRKENERA